MKVKVTAIKTKYSVVGTCLEEKVKAIDWLNVVAPEALLLNDTMKKLD